MELDEVKAVIEKQTKSTKEQYEGLETVLTDEAVYEEEIQKLIMLQTVIMQINEIFITTVYNNDAKDIAKSSREAVTQLLDKFREEYMSAALETQDVPNIPDLDHIISWVESIHVNIGTQLFNEDFFNSVILPAYNDVSGAILDTAKEEEEVVEDSN